MSEPPARATGYSFDPFARHQFYVDINASLVRRALGRLDAGRPSGQRVRVVELAAGTGAVTEQILDELARRGRPATVIGVEPSPEALGLARERLRGRSVEFVQGDADQLAAVVSDADAAFCCNAIHLVPDKGEAIGQVARALAPGGVFACNTTFFAGAYAPGSERAYRLFIRKALLWLRRTHPDVRPARRESRERSPARRWLSAERYAALAERHGLRVVERELEVAQLPLRAWQDIGRYSLFIEGALPGVPIPIGADALEHAAAEAFAELGIDAVPRIWLQLVMQRVAAVA